MWILRASTQSSQAEVRPVGDSYQDQIVSSSSRRRSVMDILSEALEESVEVSIGQEAIPYTYTNNHTIHHRPTNSHQETTRTTLIS